MKTIPSSASLDYIQSELVNPIYAARKSENPH